jgi:hypothetical protein
MNRTQSHVVLGFVVALLPSVWAETWAGDGALSRTRSAREAIEQSHAAIWSKFVDGYGIIHDFVGETPTPGDCSSGRPNAIGWRSPIANGAMFTGLYLRAACQRAWRSGDSVDKANARMLAQGLLKCASVSDVPGFIARGVGTDGKCHYPAGSDDQTHPWFYGLHAYLRSDIPAADERRLIVEKMKQVGEALESAGWKCPCDGAFKGQFRGSFKGHLFRDAVRYLHMLRILHEVTGDRVWFDRYTQALTERPAKSDKARAEICALGFAHDRQAITNIDASRLWIYVGSQAALAELVTMEAGESVQSHYLAGLAANAQNALVSIEGYKKFDNADTKVFGHADWRAVYAKWHPQPTQADAEKLAETGDQVLGGQRRRYEDQFMRNPLAAAAIVALAGNSLDKETVERTIRHYDYTRLNMAELFFAECAYYALPTE